MNTALRECAIYHEQAAENYRKIAVQFVPGSEMHRDLERSAEKHERFATAINEADGDEPRRAS